MYIKKIIDTWFLCSKSGELIESYDTRAEAENALWDYKKGWTSLWDIENRGRYE